MATNLEKAYSAANVPQLFKTVYQPYYENAYNSNDSLWGRVKKVTKPFGEGIKFPWPIGYKGGISSGTMGESLPAPYTTVTLTHKKVYATTLMERDAIYNSMGSDAAFVAATSEDIKKTVEADQWNHRHIMFGKGDGSLGTIATGGVTDNGGGNYSLVISTATWVEGWWEENMLVNVASGTEKFVIQTVTSSTRTIVVQRQAGGSQVPAQAEVVYKQNSRNNDPVGLGQALDAVVGTSIYGFTCARPHTPTRIDAASAGISSAILNELVVKIEQKCGQCPTDIYTSFKQYQQLLDILEDKKYYPVEVGPSAKNLEGKLSWSGIGIMTSSGKVNIFPHKMCPDDRLYALNLKHMAVYRAPGYGWVKDDIGGNGYLRVSGADQLSAYIANYEQLWIPMAYMGVVHTLA